MVGAGRDDETGSGMKWSGGWFVVVVVGVRGGARDGWVSEERERGMTQQQQQQACLSLCLTHAQHRAERQPKATHPNSPSLSPLSRSSPKLGHARLLVRLVLLLLLPVEEELCVVSIGLIATAAASVGAQSTILQLQPRQRANVCQQR